MQMNEQFATGWKTTKADQEATEELSKRVPERVFDAHMHLYDRAHFPQVGTMINWGPEQVRLDDWRKLVGRQLGGQDRMVGSLVLPFPSADLPIGPKNDFVEAEVSGQPRNIRAYLVDAHTELSDVEEHLEGT